MTRCSKRDLTIRFGGHVAVDRVLRFRARQAHRDRRPERRRQDHLLQPDLGPAARERRAGQARWRGHHATAPCRAPPRGLGRAFQLTTCFPTFRSGRTCASRCRRAQAGLDLSRSGSTARERSIGRAARSSPCRLGRPRARRGSLPHGDQRKLEVAILMALDPNVFMFDEPTAGMSVDEVPTVLDLIARLKARRDKTILLVEHKMDVVRELADRIIVLHNGQLVAEASRRGDRLADRAAGLSRRIAPRSRERGMRAGRSSPSRRPHPHRRVPHPAGRRPRGAGGR